MYLSVLQTNKNFKKQLKTWFKNSYCQDG
jgi:hypothetical protein